MQSFNRERSAWAASSPLNCFGTFSPSSEIKNCTNTHTQHHAPPPHRWHLPARCTKQTRTHTYKTAPHLFSLTLMSDAQNKKTDTHADKHTHTQRHQKKDKNTDQQTQRQRQKNIRDDHKRTNTIPDTTNSQQLTCHRRPTRTPSAQRGKV